MRIKHAISLTFTLLYLCTMSSFGQSDQFGTYYNQRLSHFRTLPNKKGEIIFLGNSITDGAEWSELFKNRKIKNRGISGDTTEGVLYRLDEVTGLKPGKIFLMIGINDLAKGSAPETVLENIKQIVNKTESSSPKTRIFIQSILPVNPSFDKFRSHTCKTEEILQINSGLKEWCNTRNIIFIDLFAAFKESNSNFLNPAYTNDGLHLLGEGYLLWCKMIKRYL